MGTQQQKRLLAAHPDAARIHNLKYTLACAACALGIGFPAAAPASDLSYKDEPASKDDAIAAALAASPARFDKDLGLKGWNIPFPSYGDTVLQDLGGFRSTLAQYGIGFLEYNASLGFDNVLNTPRSNHGTQAYMGQTGSAVDTSVFWLTVDMGHYGIPGGQLQFSGVVTKSSWQPYLADVFSLNRLAYYQSLFDSKVEVQVGYLSMGQAFLGSYVGGNIANPLGQSASIQFETGMSNTPAVAPAVVVNFHITDRIYDQVGVQRSLPPTANTFLTNAQENPSGTDFTLPGAKAVYINETGYKNKAAPGDPFTWIRAGEVFNASEYTDYSKFVSHPANTKATATNDAFYILADRQIWQFAPDSIYTAYRGLYVGGSFEWANPDVNVVTKYYEARAYIIGPFPSRPKDQIGITYYHQNFNNSFADYINGFSKFTGKFARYESQTVTPAYTYNIQPGIYFTGAVAYTDHPSFAYLPKEGPEFAVLGVLFTAF
jgi:porin